MRHVGFVVATLVLSISFIGCPLLKKKTTDDDDPTPAPTGATITVTGTGAKNEGTVLRYSNETALPGLPAIIASNGTVARNFPGNGPQVAVLNRGTVVAKVAQYFTTGTLVMFDDPIGDGSKLLGWVSPKAFDEAAPPPTKTIFVPPRVIDAGAPKVVDAGGGTTTTDAGGGNATATDAGGLPKPTPGQVAVPPVNGKCPDGFTIAESMCRRKCTADDNCPRGTKCKTKSGAKVCTSD
jgi:hypothetical protein